MKNDELSTTLLTPNGFALKRELARAVNYIESVSEAVKAPAEQAGQLEALLAETLAYLRKNRLLSTKGTK